MTCDCLLLLIKIVDGSYPFLRERIFINLPLLSIDKIYIKKITKSFSYKRKMITKSCFYKIKTLPLYK